MTIVMEDLEKLLKFKELWFPTDEEFQNKIYIIITTREGKIIKE